MVFARAVVVTVSSCCCCCCFPGWEGGLSMSGRDLVSDAVVTEVMMEGGRVFVRVTMDDGIMLLSLM